MQNSVWPRPDRGYLTVRDRGECVHYSGCLAVHFESAGVMHDDSQSSSPSRTSLILRECIKRFREQPPAPSHKRSPLPFKNEDFWWKTAALDGAGEDEGADGEGGRLGEDDEQEALRQSISLLTRSTLSVGSRVLSSVDSQGEGDLDVYASTLLARCDRLMREYEAKREHVGAKTGAGMELQRVHKEVKVEEVEEEEEEEAPPPPPPVPVPAPAPIRSVPSTIPHPSPRRSPEPAASLCSSADSVFPLYLSYSDSELHEDQSNADDCAQPLSPQRATEANTASNAATNSHNTDTRAITTTTTSTSTSGTSTSGTSNNVLPLSAAEVAPFLGDEVVGQLWARLGLIRLQMERGGC